MEVVDTAFLSTAGNSTSDIANDNSGNVGFYGSTADCNVAWALRYYVWWCGWRWSLLFDVQFKCNLHIVRSVRSVFAADDE